MCTTRTWLPSSQPVRSGIPHSRCDSTAVAYLRSKPCIARHRCYTACCRPPWTRTAHMSTDQPSALLLADTRHTCCHRSRSRHHSRHTRTCRCSGLCLRSRQRTANRLQICAWDRGRCSSCSWSRPTAQLVDSLSHTHCTPVHLASACQCTCRSECVPRLARIQPHTDDRARHCH